MLQTSDPRNADLQVNINGTLVHRDQAGISPFDSVVQGGDAAWEGLRLYDGRIFRLTAHLDRLRGSAMAMGFTDIPDNQELAEQIQHHVRDRMPVWKTRYDGVEEMRVAVMGCVVNGPGESKAANIGISLPGTGEKPTCPVYVDGHHTTTLRGSPDDLAAAFQQLVDDYVEQRYAKKRAGV